MSYTYVTHMSYTYVTNMWVVVHICHARVIHICHEYVSCHTHMPRICAWVVVHICHDYVTLIWIHMRCILKLESLFVTHLWNLRHESWHTYVTNMSRICHELMRFRNESHIGHSPYMSRLCVTGIHMRCILKLESRVMTHICPEYVANMLWICHEYVTVCHEHRCLRFVTHIWNLSHESWHTYVTNMSRICHEYVTNMSWICHEYVTNMLRICHELMWFHNESHINHTLGRLSCDYVWFIVNFVTHICVSRICVSEIHVWFTYDSLICDAFICGPYVKFTCDSCSCEIHMWNSCVIHICLVDMWRNAFVCGSYVNFICDSSSYVIHMWFICEIHMQSILICDLYVTSTCDSHMHASYMK